MGNISENLDFRSYYEPSSFSSRSRKLKHSETEIEEQTQSSISSANDYFSSRAIPIPSDCNAKSYGFLGAKSPKLLVGQSCPDSCRRGTHRAFGTRKRK